jgi:predicted AlkP superfamily phosphohydrolase/phosphomutase
MKLAGPDTLLLVSSDHGFTSFRRSMNYNTWLIQNGFMVVKDNGRVMTLEDLFSRNVDSFFTGVDWSQTKAYALGLGAMYVNLQGREPKGSVPPQDYEIVREQIIAGLEAYVDPLTGEKPVHKVYKREEMYSGFDPALIPDMRVANTAAYRVSWQTSLGGFPGAMIQDNDKNWSGDHCSVDPSLVKGILVSNRPLRSERPGGPEVIDIGPTILKALGVPLPEGVDGRPLH